MSERGLSVPVPDIAREGALSAISDLAAHVRARNLSQADDLLAELLALLHAGAEGSAAPVWSFAALGG